jgi:hypothetical protein
MTELYHGLADGVSTIIMAMTFLFGGRIHPLKQVVRDRQVLISFGAGIATAYLFVGMMPELAEAMAKIDSGDGAQGPAGVLVYVMALLGFVLFYGLDHSTWTTYATRGRAEAGASERRIFGYGLYVWLLTYILVLEARGSAWATLWYAFAMSWHFLTIDHSIREERGKLYDQRGRFVLASCVILGWASAMLFELTFAMTALALGFVSGALTVNSVIMELSEGTRGRFVPFALGSFLYGALLLVVGTHS